MNLKHKIIQLADQCVKCGMCLPTCPTYQINNNENESPRGRIALMQGIVNGELRLNSKVQAHLDHCVSCLSCENICPSTVQYGTLIDSIREYSVDKQNKVRSGKIISLLLNPNVKSALFFFARLYQNIGIQNLFRKMGILKLVGLEDKDALLPKLFAPLKLKPCYNTQQQAPLGTVALFTGCIGSLFEQDAIQATISVLNTLGFNVEIPNQVCCGALHQHSGFPRQAELFAEKNQLSFLKNKKFMAILFTASGCGAQLKQSLTQPHIPIQSVMHFIYKNVELNSLALKPIESQIAIHQPCSLKNVLHEDKAIIETLKRIPKLKIDLLKGECCGAAGKNMLTQPQLAKQMRQPLLKQIDRDKPDFVISSNIGCALHLKSGLSSNILLKHPIELLAESIN